MTESPPTPVPPPEPRQADTDCWYLTGATATGKTAVGLELAERINGEIISLDSMALFRKMDIGTAKPTAEQQARIPHHMLDVADPNQSFSVASYIERSHQLIGEIRGRGKEVLFVGGTPLYLKSMLRGLQEGPPPDWEFREQIEKEVEEVGVEALHARLQQIDPLAAAKFHVNDKRRIIRALEFHRSTGTPISHSQIQFDDGLPAESCKVFALRWPRLILHDRINDRVDQMFKVGLVDEVQSVVAEFGAIGRTASQAVGYPEVMAMLDGQADLDSTIEAVKARTRQFARRQETWFRSLREVRFIERSESESISDVVEAIIQAAGQTS